MRSAFYLISGILLITTAAGAQVESNSTSSASAPGAVTLALNSSPAAMPIPDPAPPPAPAPSSASGDLFATYGWQLSFEYTYLKFYEQVATKPNTNGMSLGMAHYFWRPFGVEGELTTTFGSQFGDSARFAFAGGGARARYPSNGRFEPWGHFLIGYSHYVPQLAGGYRQGAFGYEMGGGLDYRVNDWLSARAEADAIGSSLYGSYQLSPKIALGIVFNY